MSKRWMTVDWPTVVERKHPSKAAAYRHVIETKKAWLADRSRVNKITVRVSDDKGPWELYESLNLND